MPEGAQPLGTVTQQAARAEHCMQMTDVGAKDSAPDVWVRVLSHVSPLGLFVSKAQTTAGLETPNPSPAFPCRQISGHTETSFGLDGTIFHPVTELASKNS